jgi:hypothetical protein
VPIPPLLSRLDSRRSIPSLLSDQEPGTPLSNCRLLPLSSSLAGNVTTPFSSLPRQPPSLLRLQHTQRSGADEGCARLQFAHGDAGAPPRRAAACAGIGCGWKRGYRRALIGRWEMAGWGLLTQAKARRGVQAGRAWVWSSPVPRLEDGRVEMVVSCVDLWSSIFFTLWLHQGPNWRLLVVHAPHEPLGQ